MKKLYCLLLGLATVLLTGCNDWLDVSPRSQIESNSLFQTEEGFKRALNGVYIKMGQSSLYGRNISMYIPECLARTWKIPTKSANLEMYSLCNYDFTESGTEKTLAASFKEYFNAIAQLNDILYNLQNRKTVLFQYNNDKLIEGEILGLRAFLHLEVLRLWGPIPQTATDNTMSIPYLTDITNDVSKLKTRTWGEVISFIEKDLNDSEKILKEYDTILLDEEEQKEIEDQWQTMRQGRFNYYAVLGTKARFYHWIGNKELAVENAKKVVESEKMPLCTESTIGRSLTMMQEHLFNIDNVNLLDLILTRYYDDSAIFTQTKSYVDNAYENGINANDIRYGIRYWDEESFPNGNIVYTFYKYIGNDDVESDKKVPLLRTAEMYLILIEDLPLEEAKPYFSTYRITRGLSQTLEGPSMESDESRLERLEKEYRKEFFGEGQMFFFYKKHNYKQFTWPRTFNVPASAYVLPKPKGMSNFE